MNFVLTGHMGLIGTSLYKRLVSQGHTPVALCDLRAGNDINSMGSWILNEKIDIVYHLASFCKINECIRNPDKAFINNVCGTYQVMEFCKKNNVPKIVFTSSSRVLYPEKNPYTASKIYGEEIVQSYGIEHVIIRPSTVYGPFDDLTERVTHKFIMSALRNEDLIIYGDENKTLDFTYIDDFIEAFMALSQETNKSFNIGSGRGTKLSYVAELIIAMANSKSRIIYKDAEKLQPQNVVIEATDYPCNTPIEHGMKKTFDYWR